MPGGLPHSEIPGSTIARISPGLFAACHVLHRLSVPRHPPDALVLLDPGLSERPLPATQTPRTTAAHRDKPHLAGPPIWQGSPLTKVSLCQGFPAGAASSMKTLLRTARMRVDTRTSAPSASVTFTNSLYPFNQHRPDTRSPARDRSRPVDPTPEQTWSSPNVVFRDQMSQGSEPARRGPCRCPSEN